MCRLSFVVGRPRRKMHQTEEGGFRVFRPATRDLLLGPGGIRPPLEAAPAEELGYVSG